MKSKHAAEFNHDPWAAGYDADVADESDPIRAGYSAVLDWVAAQAAATPQSTILDLGCGTGNLALRLPTFQKLICADISEEMMAIARQKTAHLSGVQFVKADLLHNWGDEPRLDAVISTYAIHHLTEEEKPVLFANIYRVLREGGAAAFGDLMFASAAQQAEKVAYYRQNNMPGIAEAIEEEFFWHVDSALAALQQIGFTAAARQFSDLSWGIVAHKIT